MKRILLIVLVAVFCLGLIGCGALLDGEYESVTVSGDELPIKEGSTLIVNSYQSLRNAILELVDAYETEEVLTFTGYSGDVAEDLPRVCAELKAENALCAYAVDYISYDLNHIVAYYEAHIFINYSRTKEELASLQNIVSVANAPDTIRQAIQSGKESITFSAVGSALTADAVQAVVDASYYDAPMQYPVKPRAVFSVYPNTGVSRIYSINFDYGVSPEAREALLSALINSVQTLTAQISGSENECAAQAATLLSEQCTLTKDAMAENTTAYAALVNCKANAEGMAMAYKAICDNLDIPCLVISGRLNKRAHVWNMVLIEGNYYHVDVSQFGDSGGSVFRTDEDMRSDYWWDIDLYPTSTVPVPVSFPEVIPEGNGIPTEDEPAE